jgi:hypothetical protein
VSPPINLWRMGPPFSFRRLLGGLLCLAVGHHSPRLATEVWNQEHREWNPIAADVHAAVCQRCGRNLAYRIHTVTIR